MNRSCRPRSAVVALRARSHRPMATVTTRQTLTALPPTSGTSLPPLMLDLSSLSFFLTLVKALSGNNRARKPSNGRAGHRQPLMAGVSIPLLSLSFSLSLSFPLPHLVYQFRRPNRAGFLPIWYGMGCTSWFGMLQKILLFSILI